MEHKIYIPSTIQYFQNLFAESTFCFLNLKKKVHFFSTDPVSVATSNALVSTPTSLWTRLLCFFHPL